MKQEIIAALDDMERRHGFRVLFACESGSRAWDFASRDSDWDGRFVFAWPRDHYLRVHLSGQVVTEALPGDLDLSGWDLRMALHHFGKSNASFYEWLGSPIVYRATEPFTSSLRGLIPQYFRPRPALDHYLGLAKSLWHHAGEDGADLNGKKCLYALRATLAARWIVRERAAPPIPFPTLLDAAGPQDPALDAEIRQLLRDKQAGLETSSFPVSPALRDFVAASRAELEAAAAAIPPGSVEMEPLDLLFRDTLADDSWEAAR